MKLPEKLSAGFTRTTRTLSFVCSVTAWWRWCARKVLPKHTESHAQRPTPVFGSSKAITFTVPDALGVIERLALEMISTWEPVRCFRRRMERKPSGRLAICRLAHPGVGSDSALS